MDTEFQSLVICLHRCDLFASLLNLVFYNLVRRSDSRLEMPIGGNISFDDNPQHQGSGRSHNKYEYIYRVQCHSDNNFSQITHSKNADWSRGLDRSSWHYPCLSPLSVLGVAFSSTARAQASIFQAAVRCLRLEGLPETQHCSLQFLPPCALLPFPPDCSPLPAPIFPLDMLHSCCHSALSQSQFIPSSWPYRDMHSPGRRGRTLTATHAFIERFCRPMQVSLDGLCLYIYCMCINIQCFL